MDLQNSFIVPSDIDTAWKTLLDVESIAPCMPGATLTSFTGEEFTASVKIKLGPVTQNFNGSVLIWSSVRLPDCPSPGPRPGRSAGPDSLSTLRRKRSVGGRQRSCLPSSTGGGRQATSALRRHGPWQLCR